MVLNQPLRVVVVVLGSLGIAQAHRFKQEIAFALRDFCVEVAEAAFVIWLAVPLSNTHIYICLYFLSIYILYIYIHLFVDLCIYFLCLNISIYIYIHV